MKKSKTTYIAIAAVLLFLVLLANLWSPFHTGNYTVDWDGDTLDGPVGAVAALLIGGAALLIGMAALAFATAVVGVVMTGVGLALVTGLAFFLLLAAVIAVPFTLPLLVPLAIVWWLVSRARKNRALAQPV